MSLLGPEAGIWGAIIGGVIGGIFGGCIISVSGPTAPTASQIAILMTGFIVSSSGQSDIDAIFLSFFKWLNNNWFFIFEYFKIHTLYSIFCCSRLYVWYWYHSNIESNKVIFRNSFIFGNENFDQNTLLISIPSLFIMFFGKELNQSVKFWIIFLLLSYL